MVIGKPERATQNRIIALFRDELGYRYLGDWLEKNGYTRPQINRGSMLELLTGRIRLI